MELIVVPLLYLKHFEVGRNCVPISSTFSFQCGFGESG